MERLLKPKEVAEILGVSMTVMREMIWSKQISYIDINKGGQYIHARFSQEHIDDFKQKCEVRAG